MFNQRGLYYNRVFRIRNFSGPSFPTFGLNTERYGHFFTQCFRCEFFSEVDFLQFVKFAFSFLVSLRFGQYTYINFLRGNLTICWQQIIYIFCLTNLSCVAFNISVLQEFSVLKFDMIKMIHAFGNWSCIKDVHSSNPPMFTKICNPYWISNATTLKCQF